MYVRKCQECAINYPTGNAYAKCRVCGNPTSHLLGQVDNDWEKKVSDLLLGDAPDVVVVDEIFDWRLSQLQDAGFTPFEALSLAADRRVDLRRAVSLRGQTELAYQILA